MEALGEEVSPRITLDVSSRKRGVSERSGRVRERGEILMARRYRNAASTSIGNQIMCNLQKTISRCGNGMKNKSGNRKGIAIQYLKPMRKISSTSPLINTFFEKKSDVDQVQADKREYKIHKIMR